MQFDNDLIRSSLRSFDFKSLFNELGWDHHTARHEILCDGETFTLSAVAHKRGVQIFECAAGGDGKIPEYATRRKIDKQVTKLSHEHLTIFFNKAKSEQIWQWVSKEPGQPARYHEQRYHVGQSGEALLQKLEYLTFPLSAEESLTISGVTIRLRDAFQRERVTRRFYDRFKDEHAAFLKFLDGIPDKEMERWYVSVMINRLMFIYFVQKKGFLNGDQDYLKHKLAESRERGNDLFYKQFLCPLFFEGFAKKEGERSVATNRLLGDVPYFNGGLFLKHQIEELHGKTIDIGDKAFEKLFDFFDQYQWHLDERPLRDDREINPDVLGYIFEKYINQKQMGAYYSKEDITGYISKNTVLPFLFDVALKNCRIAFEGETSVWRLLQTDPDRYIHKAVRHGLTWDVNKDQPLDKSLPLPSEIEKGLDTSKANLLERRKGWNRPAPQEYALPTEIWREVIVRRQRYEEVRAKLAAGAVRDINDLITYNLDIIQFAQDVIENCEGPELLRAFWHAIVGRVPEKSNEKFQPGVSILDPACGSGAFLFAALNILEPLYEACLVRMEAFLGDLERSGEKHRPEKFADFRRVLERVSQHTNRRYFILKSIIVNNLFGVDIMDEAVEICKLRLFLKLVAQVQRAEQVEPLPDIDFNILAGNALVGYSTIADVKKAVTSKLAFDNTMERIEERANDIDLLSNRFRQQQIELGGDVTAADKKQLRDRLKVLEDELNGYLAGEYGIKANQLKAQSQWLSSHKPFHWFIEFHSIMKEGGFDVIIGNPPYVEYKDIKAQYSVRNFATLDCGDLYALVMERSTELLAPRGGLTMILPVSVVSTDGFASLRRLLVHRQCVSWTLSFAERPSKLFEGVEKRLTIWLSRKTAGEKQIFLSAYNRWLSEEREHLFSRVSFVSKELLPDLVGTAVPKVSSVRERNILSLLSRQTALSAFFTSMSGNIVYYTRKLRYFIQFLDFVPKITDSRGKVLPPTELKTLTFGSPSHQQIALAALNSSLFFWFFTCYSDVRNVNRREMAFFPCSLNTVSAENRSQLNKLGGALMNDLKEKSKYLTINYKKYGELTIQTFQPRLSKGTVDEIDRVLAKHYGFTDEQLDFIINFDIKYRMGLTGEQEDEE